MILDSHIESNPSRNSSHRWAKIYQELDYYVDGTDGDGNNIYQPFISLQCRTVDFEHNKNNYYGGYYNSFFVDDGLYYTVNWLVIDL